jgi:uncharacterized membrane protein
MKKFILIAFVVLAFAPCSPGFWPFPDTHQHEQALENQLQQAHQELKQEKQHGQTLENIIIVLGIGCVVLLITGAAIGSKCRRDFKSDGGDEQ